MCVTDESEEVEVGGGEGVECGGVGVGVECGGVGVRETCTSATVAGDSVFLICCEADGRKEEVRGGGGGGIGEVEGRGGTGAVVGTEGTGEMGEG